MATGKWGKFGGAELRTFYCYCGFNIFAQIDDGAGLCAKAGGRRQ